MAIENFTTYTEVDAGSKITKTATRITFADLRRSEESYVYKDKTADYFDGDFTHLLTVNISAHTAGAEVAAVWVLANLVDDIRGIDIDSSGDALFLLVNNPSSPDEVRLQLTELDGGTQYESAPAYYTIAKGASYYLKVVRDESVGTYGTLYCYIYSDAARTTLLTTLTSTLHTSKKDFRYVYPLSVWKGGSACLVSGYVEDLYISQSSDASTAPSVTTEAVSSIAKTTATGNGTVVSLGVPAATQHGVCWATFENPQIPAYNPGCSSTEDGVPAATGAYTSSMTSLKANTKYYVRAYITNLIDTFYGTQVEFWTLPDVPEVTTYLAKNVACTTALGSGNIDNNGGSAISEHGVLWRAGADPTISTYDGITELGATTWKYFESLMTSLTANTEYYYRAYATNDEGTGYGDVLKFTTNVAGAPIVKTRATINITPTSATGRGEIVDLGGSPVTEHGHCWKTVTDPPTFPTTSDSKTELGDGTADIVFLSELADLTAGTAYVICAYATNAQDTSYGDAVNINEVADELKGQIAWQGEHLLYTPKSGKQRRLLGAQ